MKGIIKLLILVIVVAAALPFALQLLPEPLSIDRIQAALAPLGAGEATPAGPQNEAEQTWHISAGEAEVIVHYYPDRGKLSKWKAYLSPDPGAALVESMGLRESFGAAPDRNKPVAVGTNGYFLLTATGENKALNSQIVDRFEDL